MNPYQYASYRFDDETSFYYLRNRYYDPRTGRFISKDKFVGTLQQPETQNRYAYCGNNPVTKTDSNGEFAEAAAAVAGGLSLGPGGWAALAVTGVVAAAYIGYRIAWARQKKAEEKIRQLQPTLVNHLNKLANAPPNDPNRNKWRKEAKDKIKRMKNKLRRLRGNTRTEWEARIAQYESRLNKL